MRHSWGHSLAALGKLDTELLRLVFLPKLAAGATAAAGDKPELFPESLPLLLPGCYAWEVARRDTNLDWDLLLNGEPHILNLAAIGFAGGINDLRALAYREADKRRINVATHKINAYTLDIRANLCVCGAAAINRPHEMHCNQYVDPGEGAMQPAAV